MNNKRLRSKSRDGDLDQRAVRAHKHQRKATLEQVRERELTTDYDPYHRPTVVGGWNLPLVNVANF